MTGSSGSPARHGRSRPGSTSGTRAEKLLRLLRARRRGYERVRVLKEIDRVFLGGIVKKTSRRLSQDAPQARRIGVLPPED